MTHALTSSLTTLSLSPLPFPLSPPLLLFVPLSPSLSLSLSLSLIMTPALTERGRAPLSRPTYVHESKGGKVWRDSMMAAMSGLMYITPASCGMRMGHMDTCARIENGNGTHHIAQAVWADARFHQFTSSEVNNLGKLTLMNGRVNKNNINNNTYGSNINKNWYSMTEH